MAAEVNNNEDERQACIRIDPVGFQLRAPPPPHRLASYITKDGDLFQTIHMGAAVVDEDKWKLVVDGLVKQPLVLSLEELRSLPTTMITSFHECYGSPLKPPVEALWRVGNVEWTGVRLRTILDMVMPLPEAQYVWSDGLDYGEFAGKKADRYQKDLPLWKAMSKEVLVAFSMNGAPLSKARGSPVRLVVPGWFGTNSTKWLCRLSLQPCRAPSLFTTQWYNEEVHSGSVVTARPVWSVDVNSVIVSPAPGAEVRGQAINVGGWAWSCEGVVEVDVGVGNALLGASVVDRKDFGWQKFQTTLSLSPGTYKIFSRATSLNGIKQPLSGRRNHIHSVEIEVKP